MIGFREGACAVSACRRPVKVRLTAIAKCYCSMNRETRRKSCAEYLFTYACVKGYEYKSEWNRSFYVAS